MSYAKNTKKYIISYTQRNPWLTLITISLLSGLLWRLEVEYHGWVGLTWISYFHYAVPVGFGLFLLWVNLLLKLTWLKRLLANVAAVLTGLALFEATHWQYTMIISGFNPFLAILINIGLLLGPPITAVLALFTLDYKPSTRYSVFAGLGMVASIFIAEHFLGRVGHKGGTDFIHTIKSGFIIPLWMFSIGLVFIGAFFKKRREENGLMIEKVEEIGNQA